MARLGAGACSVAWASWRGLDAKERHAPFAEELDALVFVHLVARGPGHAAGACLCPLSGALQPSCSSRAPPSPLALETRLFLLLLLLLLFLLLLLCVGMLCGERIAMLLLQPIEQLAHGVGSGWKTRGRGKVRAVCGGSVCRRL